MKMNLDYYGLYLKSYNIAVDASEVTTVNFEMMTPLTSIGQEPDLEAFSRDITLMNTIRMNPDLAVQDQWEKLLTTIALTAGRSGPNVLNSMTGGSSN